MSTAVTSPSSESEVVVRVEGLAKTYRVGLRRRRVEAVRSVSFEVRRGECFGLLGPNGAGKTTTLKILLGLVFPSGGRASLFGLPPGPEAFRRIGYLTENPYIYPQLQPVEFLELCGRLSGVPARRLRARIEEVLERVGIAHAARRPVRKLSKGMTQRLGLAQAILHEPELVILDEPMSGLDPIGRHEVRELLEALRRAGTTLLVTSHILSDVERLCDRVAIVHQGEVRAAGPVEEVLEPRVLEVHVVLEDVPPAVREELAPLAEALVERGRRLDLRLADAGRVQQVLQVALEGSARVVSVEPRRESLEDRFVRATRQAPTAPRAAAGA